MSWKKRGRGRKKLSKRENSMLPFLSDWKYQRSISNFRPDFSYETDKFLMVIEVDEWAHHWHSAFEEMIRMVKIRESIKKPTLFIRFNPDKFYGGPNGGKYVFNKGEFNWRVTRFILPLIEQLKKSTFDFEMGILWVFYDRFNTSHFRDFQITSYNMFIRKLWENLDAPNRGDQGKSLIKYVRMSAQSAVNQHKKTKIIEQWLML